MNERSIKWLAWGGLFGGVILGVMRLLFGKGDGLISGVGNSGNRIFLKPLSDELAAAIADHAESRVITDETLAKTVSAIIHNAEAGDPEAAFIVFRIAEMQRRSQTH